MTPKTLIILTGKTAAGKDTAMLKLLARYPNLKRVVTTTSRPSRPDEQEGVDYNFTSRDEFERKIAQGDFIEYVQYAGNYYGTPKSQIVNANQELIWRIDPSMAGQVKGLVKGLFDKVIVIYLTTNDEVALKRLQERGLSQEEIEKRMGEDKRFWEEFKDNYDFVVENVPGKLDETLDKIIQIIENHRS